MTFAHRIDKRRDTQAQGKASKSDDLWETVSGSGAPEKAERSWLSDRLEAAQNPQEPRRAMTKHETFQQDVTPTYSARDLTDGGNLARIVLDNTVYTLRITRLGKLILTK